MPHHQGPDNSAMARQALIRATRPDLLRPIRIRFGAIRGEGLIACDGDTSDPFFSVKFFDHTTKKTQKVKKTLDPEWNEPDLYTWQGPVAALLERIEAKLDVYDHDKWSRNDFMGRAYFHVREVMGTRGRGPQQRWLTLGDKHDAAHGGAKMLDGVLGNSGKDFTGRVLIEFEVTAAM